MKKIAIFANLTTQLVRTMTNFTTKKSVAGVNINIDVTTYAVVDVRGNIIAEESFATGDYPNINDFVAHLSERLFELMDDNGGYDTIRSVGVGVPNGNFITGCIEDSACLPWKGKIPLASMLRDRLGMAVAVANNAHARALGEQTFGSAHGMRDFLVITLGPIMGSCVFSNGHPYLGTDGHAGEIGHICVKEDGRECSCGNRGCLETYCAEKGIVRTAYKLLEESDKPSLMRDLETIDPKIITECCEKGDELAQETYRITGEILGVAMANYASVVNPQAIIFTGGISKAGKWLFEPVRKAFEENVFHNLRGKVDFLMSTLTDTERSVLGASALAWEVKEYSLFK